ncbi:FAD:protein FMN transferase [Thomasclavelia sp.]
MFKKRTIIGFVLGCLIFTGCYSGALSNKQISEDIFAMDTYMTIMAYGDNAQDAVSDAIVEIKRLDKLLSAQNQASEIFLLNQNGGGKLSKDTQNILEESLQLWKDTNGKFDITIYPIMQAWGFTDKNYVVPDSNTLTQLLSLVDCSAINIDKQNSTAIFEKEGIKIDLGGIAKGYTSSKIMDIFRKHNVSKGLVNLGGNVQVLGRKSDDEMWQVAIKDPDSNDYLGIFKAEDCAVITSGGYERFFEQDGVRYHHIIDPATGYPAKSDLKSVTIISDDGALADGLSTSLFIMGKDGAVDYWKKHSKEFNMILLDKKGKLYITEEITNQFESKHKFQVIKE